MWAVHLDLGFSTNLRFRFPAAATVRERETRGEKMRCCVCLAALGVGKGWKECKIQGGIGAVYLDLIREVCFVLGHTGIHCYPCFFGGDHYDWHVSSVSGLKVILWLLVWMWLDALAAVGLSLNADYHVIKCARTKKWLHFMTLVCTVINNPRVFMLAVVFSLYRICFYLAVFTSSYSPHRQLG